MKRAAYLSLLLSLLLSLAGERPKYVSAGPADETVCPVHHVPLQRERVGLLYGQVADDPCDTLDRIEAREKHFPYANSSTYGGCIKRSDSPDYVEVMYCPKCREVEKTWPCVATRETGIVPTLPVRQITRLPTVN